MVKQTFTELSRFKRRKFVTILFIMQYKYPLVEQVAHQLTQTFESLDKSRKADILKSVELKKLFEQLKNMPNEDKAAYGQEVNFLRQQLLNAVQQAQEDDSNDDLLPRIDITAPYDFNILIENRPTLLPANIGTIHPITSEIKYMLNIYARMGFEAVESRIIDDDFHMFESLNFPEGHPARDDFDTFVTEQLDSNSIPYVAPAHTSTMQHRVLRQYKDNLTKDQPIAVVIPGRVFRNEDLDARHEHTFYQLEGVYVGKSITVGNLIMTLKVFLQSYFKRDLQVKTQPSYFPFTEPSFEFSHSCPFCDQKGCSICSMSGWIELIGCGLIHPKVLEMADIDPNRYSGFAFGGGLERLIMMKYGIEDIRYFEAGKLEFLRQFV